MENIRVLAVTFTIFLWFLLKTKTMPQGWSWAFVLSTDCLLLWKYSGRGLVFLHAAVKSVALRRAPSCQFKDRIYEKHTGFGCYFHDIFILIKNEKARLSWSWASVLSTDCTWKYSGKGSGISTCCCKDVALRRAHSWQLKDRIYEKHTGLGRYFHDICTTLFKN